MFIPNNYVPKQLTRKDKKKQKRQILKSRRQYKKKKYFTRKKVNSFKSKKSKHILKAEKIYNIKSLKLNSELSKKTKCSLASLRQIIKKGQGAYYSSGSRPNQTAHSWAYARLASAISGGNASKVDYHILKKGCKSSSKALRLSKQ